MAWSPQDPPIEVIKSDAEQLAKITATFSASPSSVALGEDASLTWNVDRSALSEPYKSGVKLYIFASTGHVLSVSSDAGTMKNTPFDSSTYELRAAYKNGYRALGHDAIKVTKADCFTSPISETDVRGLVQDAVETEYGAGKVVGGRTVTLRHPPNVDIDVSGLKLELRFYAEVNNFPDPKVDIDATIALGADEGDPTAKFIKFAVDIDWPWWVTVSSGGITKLVEEWLESNFEPAIRTAVLDSVLALLNDRLADAKVIFPDHALVKLTTESGTTANTGRVDVTLCPVSQG